MFARIAIYFQRTMKDTKVTAPYGCNEAIRIYTLLHHLISQEILVFLDSLVAPERIIILPFFICHITLWHHF